MDIGQIRHRNFCHLVAKLEEQGVTRRRDQGARLGDFLSASYVSQLLGGKYIGDDVARKISESLGHDRGWMDRPQWDGEDAVPVLQPAISNDYLRVDHLDGEAGMGDGRVNDDYPEVIRSMDFTSAYIRSVVGFAPPPGRLVLITGRGDSMLPTIQPGESLLVDTGIASYDGDGIYLVNLGNGQQVKRLIDHGESVHVHSDNKAYPSLPLPRGAVIGGKVYLRNRIDRFN